MPLTAAPTAERVRSPAATRMKIRLREKIK
jgi:hypothetical protein